MVVRAAVELAWTFPLFADRMKCDQNAFVGMLAGPALPQFDSG